MDTQTVNVEQSARQTLGVSLFLQSLKREHRSPSTLRAYESDLQSFFRYLNSNPEMISASSIASVNTEQVETYLKTLASRNLKLSTLKRSIASIRRFFRFLLEQGIITENPFNPVTIKPVRTNALTAEQIFSLFHYFDDRLQSSNQTNVIRYRRDLVILSLMLFNGVRQYQIPSLKLSAIERTAKTVSLVVGEKTAVTLDAPILDQLRMYLAVRRSNANTVFVEPLRSHPVDLASLRSLFKELTYALHFECNPKSIYNTYLHLLHHPDERLKILTQCALPKNPLTIYGAAANE
ncbi:MAG: site-specific integrase [Bacteroidota bacterium]